MIDLLKASVKYEYNHDNIFSPGAIAEFCDSVIHNSSDENVVMEALNNKANAFLQLGEEQKAIDIYQDILNKIPAGNLDQQQSVMKDMASAYYRLGERTNCIHNHTAESCIYPISNGGVHHDKTGSDKAIGIYKTILMNAPNDLESRWLMNIAYMTTGGYPQQVPPQFLLKIQDDDSMHLVKPFRTWQQTWVSIINAWRVVAL
jgi:tetratricopeptide (TPR) repeat protein